MKEIVINEPAFVRSFSCTGGACRDHCCKGWQITLDKQTVKKYTTSKDFIIRTIAEQSIDIVKKSQQDWGIVKFSPQTGNCPYFDEDRLCRVQKSMGAQALSQTCSVFPRSNRVYKAEVQHSLNISCPEVASIIFSDADAMRFSERVVLQDKFNNTGPARAQNKLLNQFCLSLIDFVETDVETGLYAIIKFLMFIEKIEIIDDASLVEIENAYAILAGQLQSGEMKQELAALSTDKKVKVSLVLLMQDFFRKKATTRGSGVLNYYIDYLLHALFAQQDAGLEEKITAIENAWQEIVLPSFEESAFAIKNFILYKFWQNNFPNYQGVPPLRALYMIVAEYYFIKLLASACAKHKGSIERDDLVNIVYSFHSLSQHNKALTETFYGHIESVRSGDDLSMIHLLG